MEFITGKCPKCSGELQIPQGREQIICMYCGEEINVREAAAKVQASREIPAAEMERSQEYAKEAAERFPQMLFSITDPLKDFKKGAYEPSFRAYVDSSTEIMDVIEDAYMTSDDPDQLLSALAEAFILQVKQRLEQKKNKRQQEEAMMNFNMSLVVYLDPALLAHNKASGSPLVDELLKQWKESFPKTNLKASDFDTINAGFKRRFCYITTAVCESLGKPDDCYELNLLRDYRDGYLQQEEEGEQLVKRYYDVAPTIVKHINKRPEHQEIYEQIWKDYLSPCIRLIEGKENENCKSLYQEMVDTLTRKYFN